MLNESLYLFNNLLTKECLTTSFSLNDAKPTPCTPANLLIASSNPLLCFAISDCSKSPVMIYLEFSPNLVTNILIWSGVAFCASSKITNLFDKVIPLINAKGIT